MRKERKKTFIRVSFVCGFIFALLYLAVEIIRFFKEGQVNIIYLLSAVFVMLTLMTLSMGNIKKYAWAPAVTATLLAIYQVFNSGDKIPQGAQAGENLAMLAIWGLAALAPSLTLWMGVNGQRGSLRDIPLWFIAGFASLITTIVYGFLLGEMVPLFEIEGAYVLIFIFGILAPMGFFLSMLSYNLAWRNYYKDPYEE